MDSSRLSNIFKDNNNSRIKVSDLQCVTLNSIDDNSVKELARKLTRGNLLLLVFALLLSIFSSYELYDSVTNSIEKFNKVNIGLLAMTLMSLWFLQYAFKELLSTKNSEYKKAQYGIVKSKYSLMSASKNSRRDYNINVSFPDTNTYIQGIDCTETFYESVEEGDPILVVSFDNAKAYVVSSNSK